MTLNQQRSWCRVAIFLTTICLAIVVAQSEFGKDRTSCGRTKCKGGESRKFKYEENVSYWYRYSVDVSTNLGGGNASSWLQWSSSYSRKESTLRLDADVILRFSSPCEGTVKFENASLSHDPRKYNPEFPDRAGAEFKVNLERYTLRFAYDDGRIDELCPDKQDSVWALNLKRGFLSMIQNTMHRFDVDRRTNELDVNGVCETTYRLYEAKRTSLIVKKEKNLSDCTNGPKHFSVIQSHPYKSPRSGTRGPRHPLVESRSECELTIDRNIYETIVCKEFHRLQPLSSGNTGARTESIATLRLTGEIKDDRGDADEYEEEDTESGDVVEEEQEKENRQRGAKRTSLLYDYSKTLRTGELRNARDLLKLLCKLGMSTDEMQQRFSETFTAFVQSARFLNYPSLSQLFVRGNGICKSGKKHIIDALPFMGSNAAVNVMKDLIIQGNVEESTIDKWVPAFALIPRPNRDTIAALSPLLEFLSHQLPESQFVLSYSTTIYAFCSTYEAPACGNVEEVARFLSYLEKKLEKGCAPRAHDLSTVKETLEALKAIGNMGLETETLLERLKECVDDVGGFLPMEVRVASIDAHRRMPSCEKTRDLYFLNYYRNFTLDTEIRIASYLQVMRCPDYNVVRTIKHTLKLEEINQVGTFVWSHLTNLYKSASPTRIEIQSLLTDRDLDDKFNSDRRKFSRNYDGSFFSEEYNFGGNCQGNLIFSPKSYIPRSATFNLTFDLFGESVNVFEVTTRLEGLEYYAEKFFGPDGSLPQGSEKVSGFFKKFLRSFRAVPDEQEEESYWKRVKRLPNVIDNNFNEPKISLSYRVFGNDLKYSMLNGDREIREALARLDPWEKLKRITSGKEIHYENVVMFLDSTYVVPMTSGLPMRLDFAGSAACDFKMSGLLDTKGISNGEIELVSNVAPSMSVDVVGSMTVDAFYKTAGVKLRANAYSSGAVRIHLDVKGLRSIRLSLGLPNKKMEVFSIGTDVLLTKTNGADLEEKPLGVLIAGNQPSENSMRSVVSSPPVNIISNTSCTWAALDKLIGLKLCVDYQLSNVTKNSSEPYFLLSGPALFKISLNKADPTAKNYLLEYKWTKTKEENIFRFAFDTPGSQINRELSATISFDVKTHNVTVLLRSAGNSLVAEGTYKSTENETFVDVGFDINGTKHLDASFGYASKKFQYGYTFSPQMHLIVNNERIVALSGTIRSSWKNNAKSVSQCDIDLTFRTKRVWSKLVGYIVRRNMTSLTGDFQLEYQLQKMPKKETLRFEMSLSNRSLKGFTHKTADLKLHSTAYPQLNTVIAAWYQQAFGHLELHVEVNSSPHLMDDRHKLTAQLVVSYSRMYFQNQKTKVSVMLGITKPIQNLDNRIGINHYAVGPESRTSLLIRYAPGKDISLTVNLIRPRGLMFAMEGHANMTIPNFSSMLVDVRITERSRRTYELDFSGTWFSGHNLTARGTYTDRSEASAINHNLKLYLKSPSFVDDVLLNCKLYRNYSDVSVTVYVTQEQVDRNRYAFILNHTVISPTNFVSYVEGRYKGNVYSVMTAIDTERETRMEIHLDKWRDIHLVLTTWSFGVNDVNNKGFLAELKWDANRDPALKLAVFFSLDRTITSTATTATTTTTTTTTIRPLEISGNQQQGGGGGGGAERMTNVMITLTYPGRFIVSSCRVSARNHYDYVVHATFKWNPEETIELFTATEYNVDHSWLRSISLKTGLITPFENWKKTGLSVKYLQKENKIVVSGSADWKDSQRLIAEIEGSTEQHGNAQEWKVNCGINSSLSSILSTTVNLTHRIVADSPQVVDTRLFVKYNPGKVINAWSVWYLDRGSEDTFNLTGNLHLESPVTRYGKSDLRCQLQILPEWKFLGAANFDLDKRTYTAMLTGDLHRLKESMVQFNVTTPLEKFSFVRGRFGLSERERHVVAEVVTPDTGIGTIGFEALCQLFTADYNFNVRLSLATPLELLRRSLVVAKFNNQRELDFRVAYNDMLAGIQSIWHYRSITDFHYTYLLFTPVSGLEECGVITKLIVTHTDNDHLNVDTEFTVRLSNVKVGVKGNIGPRPPPVTVTIPIKIPSNYTDPLPTGEGISEGGPANQGQGQPEEEEEGEVPSLDYEEEVTNLYWHGDIEVCTAVIEPITGYLDIDNEGSKYKVSGNLQYVQGKISLDDTLWMEDLFNMRNELKLVLPFHFLQELDCLNVFVVDMEKSEYTMQIAVNVKRNATWYETGLDVKYVYLETETDQPRSHVLRLNVKTPLDFIKFLDTNTSLEVQENFYRAKAGIRAPNCTINLLGSIETEEAFVDTALVIEIDAPLVTLPKSRLTVKRDFTSRERYVKVSGEMSEPISKSFSVQSEWYLHKDRGKASLAFTSWMEPLRNVEIDLSYLNTIGSSNGAANLTVYLRHQRDQRYKLSGTYRSNGTIDAEMYTPFKMPHFEFHGDAKKMDNDDSSFVLNGQLQNHAKRQLYAIFGNINLTRSDGSLHTLEMTIRPNQSSTSDLALASNNNLLLSIRRERYRLNVTLTGRGINGTIDANFVNSLNWDVRANTDILRVTGKIDQVRLSTFANVQVNGNATLYLHAETPFTDIRNVTVTGNVFMTNKTGDIRANGRFNQDVQRAIFQWNLDSADLFGRVFVHSQTPSLDCDKLVDTRLFFKNPARSFKNINLGFHLNVDPEKWIFAGDANLGLTNFQHIHGVYTLRLPQPYHDYHRLVTVYHNSGGVKNTSYAIRYYPKEDKLDYASDGSILMGPRNVDAHLRAWGPVQFYSNMLNVSYDAKQLGLKYRLYTPKVEGRETLVVLFDYDASLDKERRAINANVFCPANIPLASANVSYESLLNVNGTVTTALPLANTSSQFGCQFVVLTIPQRNKRYAKVFWPQDTAIVDSEYSYRSEKLDSDLKGTVHAELPLSTRHIGHLTYGYEKRGQRTSGHSELTYNKQKVLQGLYKSKSESRAGFERDRIEITIENALKPIGILYVNQYEYSAGNEGTNYPTVEFKHANIYQLNNRTAFNVIGESRIETTHTGQNIHLKAIHANRTVQLKSDYQVLPGEFDQTSWLSLADDVWISYHVNILNKTSEHVDNQFLTLNVSYPRRNFSLDGFYWITSEELKSEVKLDWDRETDKPRTVGALFNWTNLSSNADARNGLQQRAIFALRHPSFEKPVYLQGELTRRDPRDFFNFTLMADYSTDPNKLLTVSTSLRDESHLPISRRYVYQAMGQHSSTSFDLDVRGHVYRHESTLYETLNAGKYKRQFVTGDTGKLNARLDLLNKIELLFQREHNEAVKYLNVRYYTFDQRHVANGSFVNTPNLNGTGAFFFDPNEKLTWMMVNYTPDAVESLRMHGRIPDARNAVFNIWRTYEEDFSISDLSFYLKLNHSRLISSTLRWRPELKNDIVAIVKQTVMDVYEGINNDADYWKQYVKSETVNVISDVWDDAQEDLREFLDDWNNLKELQTDLDDLKIYLNNSYNANDFYIKDFVSFGIYVIDELSLRNHIQSLPNILNEIWEVMGESGEAIRNSLLSVIEAIKNAFNKVSEIVAAIVRGDSITQVASIIEKLLEKYDKFVKDLHVSLIKYIEDLWIQISQSISQQWNRFLLAIEPLFIRFIHYLETVAWKASKEVIDFLYDRGNDLIASPYFDRFSNFTQDIDRFYRDIKANDIITNIQKYSGLVIRFLKEKYFTFVPFGKELRDVVDEIVNELKELQKLPTIRYACEKIQQVYDRAYYVYDYLEIRAKIESVVRLIHSKLMDVSQSALQAENRYREAKTMFIFDPNEGLMCFEQKLPMSWHAFNQTPEFHEIPEFRAITDLKSYFVSSNMTFWSVYRYKLYADPVNWLPPFKAQAMIIGSSHFITFDGRHLDFFVDRPCTYLLAHDFVRDTFTILLQYEPRADRVTHKIVVLLGNHALELDIFNDSIKLVTESKTESNLVLPLELENGTTYVYQTDGVVIVERKKNQLQLECNLKFDLCTLKLSGWYHGKTAGILGTMNYEPTDDTLASNGIVERNVTRFAESWSIDRYNDKHRCSADPPSNNTTVVTVTGNFDVDKEQPFVSEFCKELFVDKYSQFGNCFDVVEPNEYAKICLNTARSKSEVCTLALSYMQVCMFRETHLRIPDVCSSCSMMDGRQVAEGQFEKVEGDRVPRSTDVVFIVEGKECNYALKENRSIEQLVAQLSKEFKDQSLVDTRWSLVVFGADGVFDRPRSIVFDGQIFTKSSPRFVDYFDHVPIGNGSQDIFAAIAYASKLVFRAGVSKTFILMPCSHCEPENQTLDYSVIHQVLLEQDITLHILMDGDFEFEKERLNKIFYGLDATKSYTKKDARTLVGDVDLRRQVKLSKTILGYCTPLALEINGTVFTGDKLRFDKLPLIKKFVSVFSKRVALTAQPNPCQNCECTVDNNGVTRMECIPCVYPTPISVDYETFNLNASYTSLQPPFNFDYDQIDVDDS